MRCPSSLSERERKGDALLLLAPFCSIQAFDRLDAAHPLWGECSTLQNPPIQMLTSSGNTLIDTPRNSV